MQLLAGLHRPALPDRLALFRQFAHALARYARRRDFSRPLTHRTRLALFFRRKRAGVRPPVRRGWQIFDLSNLRPRPCRLPPARRGHAHTRGLVTRARRLATGRRVDTAGLAGLLFLVNVTHFQAVHHISALDYPLGFAAACSASSHSARGRKPNTPQRSPPPWHWAFWRTRQSWSPSCSPSIYFGSATIICRWPFAPCGRAACSWPPHSSPRLQLAAKNTSTWQSIDSYGALPIWDLVLGMVRVLWWFCGRLLTTAHWLPLPIYLQQTWELYLGAVVFALLFWLIWRHKDPLRAAALATLIGLFPFLLLTEATILGLPAGPSRYLYLASTGFSLLIAWGLNWTRRHASPLSGRRPSSSNFDWQLSRSQTSRGTDIRFRS